MSEGMHHTYGLLGYAQLSDAEQDTHLVTIRELDGQKPEAYFGHRKFHPVYSRDPQSAPGGVSEGMTDEAVKKVRAALKECEQAGRLESHPCGPQEYTYWARMAFEALALLPETTAKRQEVQRG